MRTLLEKLSRKLILFFKRSGKIKKKGNSGKLEIGVLDKVLSKIENRGS